jgi:hypothetical protein
MPKDERNIDEITDDYTKRFLRSLNANIDKDEEQKPEEKAQEHPGEPKTNP